MKRIFLSITILFYILTSCVTQRKCNLKFPPSSNTTTIVKDSIIETIRDTTIYIEIPGEVVHDSIPIPCPPPPPTYIPKRVTIETPFAKASAWWSYPVIKLELIQKDTTLAKRLKGALREIERLRNQTTVTTIIPAPVKYTPTIYKISLWMWIGVIVSILGYIGLKKLL